LGSSLALNERYVLQLDWFKILGTGIGERVIVRGRRFRQGVPLELYFGKFSGKMTSLIMVKMV